MATVGDVLTKLLRDYNRMRYWEDKFRRARVKRGDGRDWRAWRAVAVGRRGVLAARRRIGAAWRARRSPTQQKASE